MQKNQNFNSKYNIPDTEYVPNPIADDDCAANSCINTGNYLKKGKVKLIEKLKNF